MTITSINLDNTRILTKTRGRCKGIYLDFSPKLLLIQSLYSAWMAHASLPGGMPPREDVRPGAGPGKGGDYGRNTPP